MVFNDSLENWKTKNPCCQDTGCFSTSPADVSECGRQQYVLVQWSHVAIVFPPSVFYKLQSSNPYKWPL
jgi:hypothetical protein